MSLSWDKTTLGDALRLEYGKPLPPADRSETGRYAAYGANGVKCRTDRYYFDKPSIIVGRKGSAGEVTLVEQPFWPLDVTYFVTFDSRRHSLKFLFWALKHLELPKYATGVKPGLNRNKVYSIPFAFPPLAEQERIVVILDEAFEAIDKAIATTEKNLANTRVLFQSGLQHIFSDLGAGKSRSKLIDLCDPDRGITYGVIKLGDHDPSGVPCLRTSNVRPLHIETHGMKLISMQLSNEYKRTILQGGEVLVNVRGTLGGVARVPLEMAGWNVSREVAVVPSRAEIIDSDYLAAWIASPVSQTWLSGVKKGAAYTGINLGDLRQLPVRYPVGEQQQRMVQKLTQLFQTTSDLEHNYRQKAGACTQLKQSILLKAFSGKLTESAEPTLQEGRP